MVEMLFGSKADVLVKVCTCDQAVNLVQRVHENAQEQLMNLREEVADAFAGSPVLVQKHELDVSRRAECRNKEIPKRVAVFQVHGLCLPDIFVYCIQCLVDNELVVVR